MKGSLGGRHEDLCWNTNGLRIAGASDVSLRIFFRCATVELLVWPIDGARTRSFAVESPVLFSIVKPSSLVATTEPIVRIDS